MKNLLYISLHKFYKKKRNLLKTVALRVKGNLTPSSPPVARHCEPRRGEAISKPYLSSRNR